MKFKRIVSLVLFLITPSVLLSSCKKSHDDINNPDNGSEISPNENKPNEPDNGSENENDNPGEDLTPPGIAKENLFFSSFYNGESYYDCALSITTTKDLEYLKGVKLTLNTIDTLKFTYTFEADLTLNKNEKIIIYNKDFTKKDLIPAEYKTIALESNVLGNSYRYDLVNEDNIVIDRLGMKGLQIDLAENRTLLRLKEFYKPNPIYRSLDFVKKLNENDKFETEPSFTLNEFLEGPKLDETLYGDLDFVDLENKTTGTGGYLEVELKSLGDGDTTEFIWPEPYSFLNGYKHRVRYLLINTPEIDHGPGSNIIPQPFGQEAKKYNNDCLRNASIIVQSDKDGSVHDNYGRTLGFVWYTNVDNPKISDYRLLNYEIVLKGLASISYDSLNEELMVSNGISYHTYIRYAYELASEKGIKIHGEKDPTFEE